MTGAAKKITLPQLTLTEVVEGPGENTTQINLCAKDNQKLSYYTVPMVDTTTGKRRNARPKWIAGSFPLYPVVLNLDGSPWAEANLWILDMLEAKSAPNMLTYATIADDLVAYRRYLDDEEIDWLHFPAHKLRRPTYRFNASLKLAVETGEVASSVAKRRMGTVVRFYRWLMSEALFEPTHAPWVESDRFIEWRNQQGFSGVIAVKTTDVSIKNRIAQDPWDERIQDGGKLRPLSQSEQEVLLTALADIGNTEMSLIHLFSFLSGARMQTVLTTRLRHVAQSPQSFVSDDFRLKCGPGTGIDTKNDTKGILHLPKWFYECLYTYAHSERARKRRQKSIDGDHPDQMLFLSHKGAVLYEERAKRGQSGSEPRVRRHAKTGGNVRQFIKEKLLPEMRRVSRYLSPQSCSQRLFKCGVRGHRDD
jgi:hypothetical protein